MNLMAQIVSSPSQGEAHRIHLNLCLLAELADNQQ
jgi:hypothetical protein